MLSHSGFMLPVADPEGAAVAVREFLTTPIEWYMHLAIATSEHGRVSLSKIRVPAAFVAAKWDVLAGSRDMASAAARIPEATYVELAAATSSRWSSPTRCTSCCSSSSAGSADASRAAVVAAVARVRRARDRLLAGRRRGDGQRRGQRRHALRRRASDRPTGTGAATGPAARPRPR